MRILMVCLGNICRSPLAEGLLQHKARQEKLDWMVDSAGTGSWHSGEPPDPRSIAIARKYGIDISGQRARQIKPADLVSFEFIFAMDQANYQDIRRLANAHPMTAKLELIMNLVHPGSRLDVPDPYWDDDGFEEVYRMLDQATDRFLTRTKGLAG